MVITLRGRFTVHTPVQLVSQALSRITGPVPLERSSCNTEPFYWLLENRLQRVGHVFKFLSNQLK